MKPIALRMDIDTVVDASSGLRNAIKILKSADVQCTFFVNLGRSIGQCWTVRDMRAATRKIGGKGEDDEVRKIGLFRKLGSAGFAQTLLRNPKIGGILADRLQEMTQNGHEVALHGGRNHGVWQHSAKARSPQWALDEIRWGKTEFEKLLGFAPIGFASPGFVLPPGLRTALAKLGFKYHSDTYGKTLCIEKENTLVNIPVNVIGPGSVPITEFLWAKGTDEQSVVDLTVEMACEQAQNGRMPVIYAHPSVEANILPCIFERILHRLVSSDLSFVTLGEAVSFE